ncbi:MAG: alpha-L-fucosidase [Planctomycetota bacterium]|jgi:alpha-L-fucosidase
MMIDRREFMKAGVVCSAVAMPGCIIFPDTRSKVPYYLRGYEDLHAKDPRAAALAWFRDAKFGLFMHYGLYSILGRHEWVQFKEQIPIAEYEKLTDQFTAEKFDADFITDLALDAGMKYVNLTSKHHDGFCLFDTGKGSWNSVAVAGRDLCAELAEQCQKKGLGCFFYYSLYADWHHPYFYPRKFNSIARPDYETEPEQYKFEKDEDFQYYLDDAIGHVRTLLTHYGPIAGIWLDPLMGYYGRPDLFPMEDIYAMVRGLQGQCLISSKQGITGTEDFAAPERSGHSLEDTIRKRYGDKAGDIAAKAWASNKKKHNEICDTLQPHGWGYIEKDDTKHKSSDQVMAMLEKANDMNANLLLNTGPLPDGSIHPEDVYTLREVGRRLRTRSGAVAFLLY